MTRLGRKVSRRRWLQVGSSIGAGLVLNRGLTAGNRSERNSPTSISALKSMREQVRPVTSEERRGRIQRAQELMGKNRIEAILLTGGTSLFYFTGVRWGTSERLFAAVIPGKGKAFCVCPSF
jgi:Xaa-Pro dipeptidase